MKKGIGVIIIFVALILVVNIFAYESTITVKTGKPNADIVLKIGDQETGKTVPDGILTETSNSSGEVVFKYNLEPILIRMGFQAFNSAGTILTFVNGKEAVFFPLNKTITPYVILDKFVEIDLNKAEPTIEMYSGEKEVVEEVEITDEIVEETTKIEETEVITEEQEPQITGFAVMDKSKEILTSANTYYILGGVIVLLVAIIFFRKKMNKKGNFKVTKLSEIQENKEKIDNTDDKLDDAERKLKEAKEELDEIRDKKKRLKEAQEKLERDKEELKRLERDGDDSPQVN